MTRRREENDDPFFRVLLFIRKWSWGSENGGEAKKPKFDEEKSVEEQRFEEKSGQEKDGTVTGEAVKGPASIAYKKFETSAEMFDYFFKLLHFWSPNVNANNRSWVQTSCYFNLDANAKFAKFTNSSSLRPFSSCPSSFDDFVVANSTRKVLIKLRKATILLSYDDKRAITNGFSPFGSKTTAVKAKRLFAKKLFALPKKMKSILLLNVISIVYASNIPIVKQAEAVVNPAAFSAVRFAVSTIPFLPFVFHARHDVQTRKIGMELGVWISLGYLMEALGLMTSDAGRASFISIITVIVVPLLECMLGEIIPARTWFGIFLSIIGVGMLECSGSPPCVGDLLNFLSAAFFGIHTIRTEHISRNTKEKDFLPLLGYEVCVVALFSTMWYLVGGCLDGIQDCESVSSWTWDVLWDSMVAFPWIPALYTGAFSTGLCLWAEIFAMRHVSATETAIIYGMEPLWGAGFAWFLLGERWGTAEWIGAALVLGGSMIVQMLGTHPRESAMDGESYEENEFLMVSKNQKSRNGLSASPLIISSDKDVINMVLKKQAPSNNHK